MIKIENLKKSYGKVEAVNGVSLEIKKGEMFGLVGPDGAGKTTTIRVLCGLLDFDEGSVSLFDSDIRKKRKEIQNQIGYLSQKFSLYGDLTVDENIEFFAEIHNVKNYKERSDELLEFTRLINFRDRLTDNLSGGMKQKLALACSLIHRPKILFLDEPTTGVDPVSRRDFWKILSDLLKDGLTVLITTPYLDEAERCRRVALMNKGKIMVCDTPQNIKEGIGKKVLEITGEETRAAYRLLKNEYENETQIFGDRLNIIIENNEENVENILNKLKRNNVRFTETRVITPTLENAFIHLINSSNKIAEARN
ncbi:MAG: ABC transporter ATP-binding protein [Chlorobi bacterium]|nr:ABC transporter ATP-binding protein [Chlorobiota bacterium]